MQQINNLPACYQITRYFAVYYELFSIKHIPAKLKIDNRLSKTVSMVAAKAGATAPIFIPDTAFITTFKKPAQIAAKVCYVAFSGGKDCLATAIVLKQRGYTPVLVYVAGINKSLPSERKYAEDVAAAAGFQFVVLKVSLGGSKEYQEHPFKNLLILSLMIDEGLKTGVVNYSMGNLFQENAEHGSLEYDFSDSFDLVYAFNRFIKQVLPEYNYHSYIHNNLQSFYTVFKYDATLLKKLTTCITPDYRKPMIRTRNVAIFGEELVPEGRCGNCYKCADEYIFMYEFGLKPYNKAFYEKANHAIHKFAANYINNFKPAETDTNKYGGADIEDIQVLTDRCGHYIGRLIHDKDIDKWFVERFYGRRHYSDRAYAEALLSRFKKLYKIK